MKTLKSKVLSIFALTLMISAAIFAVTANVATAADPVLQYLPTYARISPTPNPVGVGQQMLISVGLQPVPPAASLSADPKYLWNNMQINIMKPNGQNETIKNLRSDPTGSTYATYTPTTTGNYTFQLVFSGQWMNYTSGSGASAVNYTQYFYPSMSLPEQGMVTVQDAQVGGMPNIPLPSGYWTLPLSGEFKGANHLVDNWLMPGYDYTSRSFTIASTFAPYTSAPTTPHVLWTTPIKIGGVMGGPYGDRDYYTGLAYEQFYSPLIIQGQIIYTDHGLGSATSYGSRCIDMYTGKQLWYLANVTFAFAQILEMDTPNEHGGLAYLWSTSGSTWTMYDAFSSNTGEPPRMVCIVANVTSSSASRRGSINFGPNGELLAYSITSTASTGGNRLNRMTLWNSTLAIMGPPGPSVATWSPSVSATPINGARGIQWNVSLPNSTQAISIMEASGGYVLASNASGIGMTYAQRQMAFPAILERQADGTYPTSLATLWTADRACYMASYKFSNVNDGVYAQFDEQTSELFCYDVKTGAQKWVAPPLTTPWGVFSGYTIIVAYGNIYQVGYDGHCRAYDVATGELKWDFYQGSAGFETPYGTWPSYWGMNIADGKVYYSNDEHSPDANLWRGGEWVCLNATDGEVVFRFSGQMHEGAISSGYYTASNNYDGLAYTFGKGPSETTVSAPQAVIPKGTDVLITGTVTDQSPGKPNTPAISDANQPEWMAYLYQQKPIPTNVKGVEVFLTAIDPNGNAHNIGTATTDIGGTYGLTWTPPIEGTYQVMATFAGTASYGDSYATTYFAVSPAPATSPAPTETVAPTIAPTESPTATPAPTTAAPEPERGNEAFIYVTIAAVAIIAAVIAAAVILKKRK